MTSINSKMGLRPAGKRDMMKLPTDRALRTQLTAAVCPQCGRRDVRLSKVNPGDFYCTVCNHRWTPPPAHPDEGAA